MAVRARLVAPPPLPKTVWPWHTLKSGSILASAMFGGDRRMEGETYLSSGYGLRVAIESKSGGWTNLAKMARSWQPNRLKGIQVGQTFGTPFLAATQVFDVRPIPRKWLALDRTSDVKNRFVQPGMILVTCSGSVGRPTLATATHENTLISHDLLRVEVLDEKDWGWIYACLHAIQTRAMATSVHYGHIIKHLETSHLDALPIPKIDDTTAAEFTERVARILHLRNEGYRLTLEAERRFARVLGSLKVENWGENGFEVRASKALMTGRRRMEATFHNPGVYAIWQHLAMNGQGFTTVADAGYEVWLPTRFRRVPAQDGVLLVDSADLTEVNPDLFKRIADGDYGDPYRGRIRAGWILLARSGQNYGIIGTAVLAGADLEDKIISDHVIRIKPKDQTEMLPGYLVTALTHPLYGRPLVKSLTYGSSIPEIEAVDIATHAIVRLKPDEESAIAELAEASAKARSDADLLEREIATNASAIIDHFITGV